jgi:N utilization substance protein A
MSEMAEAIRELMQEKGVTEDSIKQTVESAIKAAYKKTFGTADNCVVKFADDLSDVSVYSRKTIVDGVYDPVTEIELEEALKMSDECEEGDEIDILVDPKDFERSAVSTGKQAAHQGLNESFKDNLYNEYKDKTGEVIIGYYQREHNGNIYLDLGKVEGILPVKFQSPREEYHKNDRIKAVIVDIKKTNSGLQLVLSRSDPRLVQSIVSLEVPEIEDKTISIHKIVREAGYRTKIAVYSDKEDVDPVGACVGLKGVRIQNVIRELEGEKIDVLKYDPDPVEFIKNALSPAEVEKVLITDEEKRTALAIVNESQFSLAIGKQGQNVRLANRLCDWSIDVKTEEQAAEMDLSEFTSRRAAEELFNTSEETPASGEEEISTISDLPGVDADVAAKLKAADLDDIQAFVDAYDDGNLSVEGVTQEQLDAVNKIIRDVVEFVEEDEETAESEAPAEEEADDEEYHCPECGAKITLDMTKCPNCGVEFEFE